ncbi:MAG: IS1 family transposase [Planctomycetes bacterium]|nr:IS1 family transposase [Planctomycetota bacterium]
MGKRDGYYSNGRQRWFCRTCRHSFSWRNPTARRMREMEWFRRWIVEGYSVRQLALQSGHSQRKLRRLIDSFLAQAPPTSALEPQTAQYLLFDGTFLHRPHSIAVLMDGQTHTLVRGQFDVRENSGPELRAFFEPMIGKGLHPRSFTVDGNRQVIKILKMLWPDAVIQRCLVHIQRQGLSWCRNSPKTVHARQLRKVFLQVTGIATPADKIVFLNLVANWELQYGTEIAARKEKGRVFSDIKRARSMLLLALPNMFHYLDDPNISTTTNGLEGYFSRLKSHYRQHRGLSPRKRPNYFAWYFHFTPR